MPPFAWTACGGHASHQRTFITSTPHAHPQASCLSTPGRPPGAAPHPAAGRSPLPRESCCLRRTPSRTSPTRPPTWHHRSPRRPDPAPSRLRHPRRAPLGGDRGLDVRSSRSYSWRRSRSAWGSGGSPRSPWVAMPRAEPFRHIRRRVRPHPAGVGHAPPRVRRASELDDRALAYGAIDGLTKAVGDTGHTSFLTPEERAAQQSELSGSYVGIGIRLDTDKDGRPSWSGCSRTARPRRPASRPATSSRASTASRRPATTSTRWPAGSAARRDRPSS